MAERRQCGHCTLCCKLLGVAEINKPRDTWCTMCDKSKGCLSYENRPQACRDFECLWLQGSIPEALSPRRTHAVLGSNTQGDGLVVYLDASHPVAHKDGSPLAKFIERISKDFGVAVVCGKKIEPVGPHMHGRKITDDSRAAVKVA